MNKLTAYTLTDLFAEKLRSLLQQVIRNKTRRQDIFDLMLLNDNYPDLDETEKQGLLRKYMNDNGFERWVASSSQVPGPRRFFPSFLLPLAKD